MPPFDSLLVLTIGTLAGLMMLCTLAAWGWGRWLAQRAAETSYPHAPAAPSAAARIEVADLRERVKKLEAIAAGVDL